MILLFSWRLFPNKSTLVLIHFLYDWHNTQCLLINYSHNSCEYKKTLVSSTPSFFQVFDRISSKTLPPIRMPLNEAVQKARDAADALRELEHRRDADHSELQELRDLLCRPHFKVSSEFTYYGWKINKYFVPMSYIFATFR